MSIFRLRIVFFRPNSFFSGGPKIFRPFGAFEPGNRKKLNCTGCDLPQALGSLTVKTAWSNSIPDARVPAGTGIWLSVKPPACCCRLQHTLLRRTQQGGTEMLSLWGGLWWRGTWQSACGQLSRTMQMCSRAASLHKVCARTSVNKKLVLVAWYSTDADSQQTVMCTPSLLAYVVT